MLVAGLRAPDRGKISIGGVDATLSRRPARWSGFVFQQYSL